jgi:hypothetical protein
MIRLVPVVDQLFIIYLMGFMLIVKRKRILKRLASSAEIIEIALLNSVVLETKNSI